MLCLVWNLGGKEGYEIKWGAINLSACWMCQSWCMSVMACVWSKDNLQGLVLSLLLPCESQESISGCHASVQACLLLSISPAQGRLLGM